MYVSRSADVVHHVVKAARATAIGLQRRTFATLFAAWASFLGSFYSFFKNVLIHSLLPALATAEDKLRMVAQVASHSKLRQMAQQVLADESQQLSVQVRAVLTPLCGGGPSPAVSQSSDTATGDTTADTPAAAVTAPVSVDRSASFAAGGEEEDMPPYSVPPSAAAADHVGDGQSQDRPLPSVASTGKRPADVAAIADDIDDIFGGSQATVRKTKKRRADKTRGEERPERRPADQRPPPADGDDIDDLFFAFNRAVTSSASRTAK
jgi:hypothetical protein